MRPFSQAKLIWFKAGYKTPLETVMKWHAENEGCIVHSDSECFLLARPADSKNPDRFVKKISDADAWNVTLAVGEAALKKIAAQRNINFEKIIYKRPLRDARARVFEAKKFFNKIERKR